jgi:hypothetical protein
MSLATLTLSRTTFRRSPARLPLAHVGDAMSRAGVYFFRARFRADSYCER